MVKIENLKSFKGKKIKILLKNRFCYSGYITSFLDDSIMFQDKFGGELLISVEEISNIEVLK